MWSRSRRTMPRARHRHRSTPTRSRASCARQRASARRWTTRAPRSRSIRPLGLPERDHRRPHRAAQRARVCDRHPVHGIRLLWRRHRSRSTHRRRRRLRSTAISSRRSRARRAPSAPPSTTRTPAATPGTDTYHELTFDPSAPGTPNPVTIYQDSTGDEIAGLACPTITQCTQIRPRPWRSGRLRPPSGRLSIRRTRKRRPRSRSRSNRRSPVRSRARRATSAPVRVRNPGGHVRSQREQHTEPGHDRRQRELGSVDVLVEEPVRAFDGSSAVTFDPNAPSGLTRVGLPTFNRWALLPDHDPMHDVGGWAGGRVRPDVGRHPAEPDHDRPVARHRHDGDGVPVDQRVRRRRFPLRRPYVRPCAPASLAPGCDRRRAQPVVELPLGPAVRGGRPPTGRRHVRPRRAAGGAGSTSARAGTDVGRVRGGEFLHGGRRRRATRSRSIRPHRPGRSRLRSMATRS